MSGIQAKFTPFITIVLVITLLSAGQGQPYLVNALTKTLNQMDTDARARPMSQLANGRLDETPFEMPETIKEELKAIGYFRLTTERQRYARRASRSYLGR